MMNQDLEGQGAFNDIFENVLDTDFVVAQDIARVIFSELELPEGTPEKPMVFMIGGLPGSGKTTVIESLKDEFGWVVVRSDVIRGYLKVVGLNYKYDPDRLDLVEITKYILLQQLMTIGYSIALDSNAIPERIKIMEKILKDDKFQNYYLETVHLDVPVEVLVKRVCDRYGRFRAEQ